MRIQIFPLVGLSSGLLMTSVFFTHSAAGAEDILAEARIVAQTERAFSVRCAEIGIRDSFLEYFSIDAIHFDPEPRLARPDLERKSSSIAFRLTWEPKIIRVANSGQLAVSTGPYILENKTGDRSSGYFLSIWKKQNGGAWRVGADIGVPAPQALELPEDFEAYQDLPAPELVDRSMLLAFEREQFERDADVEAIYQSFILPETTLERPNLPLMVGRSAYQSFLSAQKTKRTALSQVSGDVSGNLGFTYGTESDGKSRTGYLRVWVWRQSRWWLVFDVVANLE
jgi:ketosteroid isomerase-like protein